MSAQVLLLDADDGIGAWMRDALLDAGLSCQLVREDAEADRSLDEQRPSLVVVPVSQVDRWAALLAHLDKVATGVPVLGAVSRDASLDFTAALAFGVTDLVTYPCSTEDLVVRVATTMRGRRSDRVPERVQPASPLATLRSVTEAAEKALLRTETAAARVARPEEREHLRVARDTLAHSLRVILSTMIGNTEASGHGREGHARLAASLGRSMTTALGWPPARVRGMEMAAMFADIGLLAIPGAMLAVDGPLTEETLELVRGHPETSAEILEPLSRVGVPVTAVRSHHERLDGSGYPRGLRGRQIPFGAQVLAVIDSYAAMVQPRPHRRALEPEAALAVLREEADAGRLAGRLVDLLREVVESGGHASVGSGNGNAVRPLGNSAHDRSAPVPLPSDRAV
ncbi:MAG TPA: HD domain-containing phosphohydrolase [Actinomycetes bacterium]|nr:HD domain-containing phosphohydrolase [Actinomycetes bacterium]